MRSQGRILAVVVPLAAVILVLVAAYVLNQPGSYTLQISADLTQSPSRTSSLTSGIMIIAVPLLVLWAASLYTRCTDLSIRKYFIWIVALCVLWLLSVLIKYMCSSDLLSSLLWYFYYVPMGLVPLMCSFIALHMAFYKKPGIVGAFRIICTAITVFLIVLVLTNNLHYQVFEFDFADPNWEAHYSYNWGYWAFMAWTIGLYVVFFALLFWSAHVRMKGLFAPAILIGLLAVVYAVLYILRIGHIFTSNFSLTYIIMLVACIELMFRLGLLPSFSEYKGAFDALPFDAKILANDLSISVETKNATPLEQDVKFVLEDFTKTDARDLKLKTSTQPDRSYEVVKLRGGIALFIEDRALINARRKELEQTSDAIRSHIAVLENSVSVDGELYRLESERRLLDMIDEQLGSTVDVITELLDSISEQTPLEERKRTLAFVRLLVGYCKRMGAFVLASAANDEFDSERLTLVLGDTAADARASGISCAGFVEIEHPLPKESVLVLYDCMYDILTIAFQYTRSVAMFSLLEHEDGGAEFSATLEVVEAKEFTGSETAERLRVFLSAQRLFYDLTYDETTLHVSVLLPRRRDIAGGVA